MSSSPSSASLSSTPGFATPTVPILTFSGGLQAPAPQVSDMPHSSPTGIPIAWKNSSTSTGVGAAPTLTATSWSSPRWARMPLKSSSSALATAAASSSGTSSPACSRRTFFSDACSAPLAFSAASPSSPASIVSSPAFIFSQMRGTAKNHCGCTSAR